MATKRWRGSALASHQTSSITVGGTWATGDQAILTINGNDLILIVGTTTTTTQIATSIANSVNAADATVNLAAGEVRNIGGQQILEMQELTAAAISSSVSLITKEAYRGKPFTVTVSKVSTSGTISISTPTAAVSPNHVGVADNWEGGLPASGDTAIFDNLAVSVLWDLDYFFTNTIDIDVIITGDYIGQIGLPYLDVSLNYPQYRSRYLQFYCAGTPRSIQFTPGVQNLVTHQDVRIRLRNSGGAFSLFSSTSTRGNNATKPSVYVHGGQITDVVIDKGRIEFDPIDCILLGGSLEVLTSLSVGGPTNLDNPYVVINGTADLDNAENLRFASGDTHLRGSTAYTGGGSPTFEMFGGNVYLTGINPSLREMVVDGGTLYPNQSASSGPKITVRRGGTVDFGTSLRTRGHSSVVLYSGATLNDPAGLGTAVVNLVGCELADVDLTIPANKKLTLSAATP